MPQRVRIAIVAVTALALFGALNSYQSATQLAKEQPDPYGAQSARQRFAAVHAKLPKNVALGYITDLSFDQKSGVTAYLAAQYALAPHALTPVQSSADLEWAVSNFALPGDYPAAAARAGYAVVEDLGRGVLVLRRKQ